MDMDRKEERTHNIKRSRRKGPKRSPDKKRLTGAFCSTPCLTVAGLLLGCKVALHLSLVVYA